MFFEEAVMKHAFVVGLLAVVLAVGVSARAGRSSGAETKQAPAATSPQKTGDVADTVALGSVRVPRRVMADGKPLPAGTYQLRVTPETATPVPPGQTARLERWVEFLQGGQVKGREVASIVPEDEIAQVAQGPKPARGGQRVEMLKGNDYLRIWVNKGGNNYLIHLPPA
jgi:hypothetical protein